MSEAPQLFHCREREIFVGIENHPASSHESFRSVFVLADGAVDFLCIRRSIIPGRLEVGGGQTRVGPQNLSIGGAEATAILQDPDGNTCFADAGIASATIRPFRNPTSSCRHLCLLKGT
jgi:hypothetical protein